MEIAVAKSSALGQYLAELDAEAEAGGASAAQLLAKPRAVTRRRRPRVAASWSWRQWGQRLRRRAKLVATRQLIPELCSFHPTIREELQQAAGIDAVGLSVKSTKRWSVLSEVLSEMDVRGADVRASVAVAGGVLAVLVAVGSQSEGAFRLKTMAWSVSVVAFVLLGLELGMRLLLAWCAQQARHLMGSLQAFENALKKLNAAFTASLTLVKRAELASRGYRLGNGLLPPIGRLETSDVEAGDDGGGENGAAAFALTNHLRCLPLRRKLRAVNDQLQRRVSELLQEGEKSTTIEPRDPVEDKDTGDDHAPSFLLTALAKQRNRSVLLLENAVHTVVVRELARACSPRSEPVADSSLLRILRSQRLAVQQLVAALNEHSDDLEAWNTTRDPVAMLASSRDSTFSAQKQETEPLTAVDPRVKGVAAQLQELRSTSETLTALVIAAQHDLVQESTAERLSSSREAMRAATRQVQEAWSNYKDELNALTGAVTNSQGVDENDVQESGDRESTPIALASPSVPASEDPNCTVVFTGTSTGDEGFDLQALLKQQELQAAAGPTPHFVRELQDVLAHRQAHTQLGLTKQVDHDPPTLKTSSDVPPPPAAHAMFALPRAPPRGRPRGPLPTPPGGNALRGAVAAAFNSELQSLLQRAPPRDFIGDSEDEAECTAHDN